MSDDANAATDPKPIPDDRALSLEVLEKLGIKSGAVVCLTTSWPPGEYGERAILVAKDADCEDCGQKHDMEKCPKCGSWIHVGFGLFKGGFGDYKLCLAECGWFWRRILEDDQA